MSTLTIQLDDDAARLVAEAAQATNQPVESWLRENICQVAAHTVRTAKSAVRRSSPLHPGAMQPALDFNAPLEEFAPYITPIRSTGSSSPRPDGAASRW